MGQVILNIDLVVLKHNMPPGIMRACIISSRLYQYPILSTDLSADFMVELYRRNIIPKSSKSKDLISSLILTHLNSLGISNITDLEAGEKIIEEWDAFSKLLRTAIVASQNWDRFHNNDGCFTQFQDLLTSCGIPNV